MIVITTLTVDCESLLSLWLSMWVVEQRGWARLLVLNCGENMNESEINSPEAGQL